MKIRLLRNPGTALLRTLGEKLELSEGEEGDVSDEMATALLHRGVAEPVEGKKPKAVAAAKKPDVAAAKKPEVAAEDKPKSTPDKEAKK